MSRNIFIFCIGIFWSFFVLLKCLFMVLRYGLSVLKEPSFRGRPSCLDDKKYGTHKKAHLKNITLHYVSNGETSKPLMIFIHGFPEFWYSWRHQLTEFQDHYHVVAFDQRGYGDSDKPTSVNDYTIDKLINDVKELIEHLHYRKAVVVGHDWGGAVAWAFAYQFPEYVDKLICLNCPNGKAFRKYLETNRGQFLKSWYMFFFQIPFLPEWFLTRRDIYIIEDMYLGKVSGCRRGQITREDIEAYKYTFGTNGFTAPINYYRAAMQIPQTVTQTIPVKPKSLLIWGEKDAFLSKETAILSEKYCDDLTLKFISNSSHWVQQDYPDEVNSAMRHFLEV